MNRLISPVLLVISSILIYTGFSLYLQQPPGSEIQPLILLVPVALGIAAAWAAQWTARSENLEKLTWLGKISTWLGVQPFQWLLLPVSLLLSVVTFISAGDQPMMRSPITALVSWCIALPLVVAAGWRGEIRRPDRKLLLTLGGVFLMALLPRIIFPETIPNALTGDEGSAGLAAATFANGLNNNIFRSDWYSFPAFYFSIPGLFIRFMGQNLLALRISAALPGALTVLAVFCIARAAFGEYPAWGTAAFMSFLHYHVHFSRIALNNIWDGLWITVTIGALWYGWQYERRNAFLLAGLSFGLSQYFYTSGRVFVLIGILWLVLMDLTQRSKLRRLLPDILLMGSVALVVFFPLGVFYAQHPDEMMAPLNRVTLVGNGWIENQVAMRGLPAWRIWLEQIWLGFGGYAWAPLRAWYLPEIPILRPEAAVFAVLGLVFAMRSAATRSLNLLIGLWLVAFAGIGAFSESTPGAQRYVASAPALGLLTGYGVYQFIQLIGMPWAKLERVFRILGLVGALLLAGREAYFYFREYTPKRIIDSAHENTLIGYKMGLYLRDHPRPNAVTIFMGAPNMYFQSIPSTQYFAPNVQGMDVNVSWSAPEAPHMVNQDMRFIILPHLQADLDLIRAEYPGGELHVEPASDGLALFYVYEYETKK